MLLILRFPHHLHYIYGMFQQICLQWHAEIYILPSVRCCMGMNSCEGIFSIRDKDICRNSEHLFLSNTSNISNIYIIFLETSACECSKKKLLEEPQKNHKTFSCLHHTSFPEVLLKIFRTTFLLLSFTSNHLNSKKSGVFARAIIH